MFSQILKDLITLHKLDSAGNVKSKETNKENKLSGNKHETVKSTKSNYTNETTSYGLKKSEAHSDLAKEFRTTFKSNQNSKYNETSSKTSFGLKNPLTAKMQSSQAKIDNINNNQSNKRNNASNNLDSKSSVNFYFNDPNNRNHKSDAHTSNEIKSSNKQQNNHMSNEYKTRDFKSSFALVNEANENEHANLATKNQNGSDASLRTRKQDALIDLAILLKKSQSKINLNGKLEDSQKLFEIQATLANEFKNAMLNNKNEETQQQPQHQHSTKTKQSNNINNNNDNFNPKYEALTKLTDEFRKNFTEIKKAYLSKDPQIVSNINPEESNSKSHKTENQVQNSLSTDFKNSTAQINRSLKNLESKSSATFNTKLLKSDIQQNSNIANEFKLSATQASRKNLASKSSATFYSNATANKAVKSDSTQHNEFKTSEDHVVSRKPLVSKSSANLYEPSSLMLKSHTQANLANEFKFSNNVGRKGLASKSSANLYTVDANSGSNMYKSDTQPNLAREFKTSFPQLNRNLKDNHAKSSTNISSVANAASNNGYSHNLKNLYIQSNEYGDTYIVQRSDAQAMTLTNEYKSSDLRNLSQENKSAYNLSKNDANQMSAINKELKASNKNINEVGLAKKKINITNDILRKSAVFNTNKELKASETQTKIVNEFRTLASRKNIESKSSSTFFANESPAASLPQPPPALVSQLVTNSSGSKLDPQTSLAREFKKSFTNSNVNLKNENSKSGISSIYLSNPTSFQIEASAADSSVDYEVTTVMTQKPSNINEYKAQYIQPQVQQPIMVGNFNKEEESQELLIELERTGISSSTPIEAINETRDSELNINLQNLNASELQKWIWTNEQEANNSLSPIPLNEYPINQDPNPIVIRKKPDQKVELKKEFFVRYLQPPRPLSPGKLIIEQEVFKKRFFITFKLI